ncbi:MAG TPA: FG-GAP-like repeat-containing protein [Vicinamibacterales bacterium]|nr:FG-GAP-like repeat-containing protein [Vicinamibacterales bacterium]
MRPLASIAVAVLILVLGPVHPSAQRAQHREAPLACRLIALPGNSFTSVGIRDAAFRHFLTGPPTATFQVTYVGFGSFPAAQAAFQTAVDIWAQLIASPVPIKIRAEFTTLPANVLGSAGGQFLWRDFPGAPIGGTWYVDALADRVSGGDVNAGNPGAFDILASFNSLFANWYFGTDGATPANQYDFVSVALHELTHGLGYSGSATVSGLLGSIGFAGFPTIYDRFGVTETGTPLLNFPNPSQALGTQLTSAYNPVNPRGPGSYWGGAQGILGNGGLSARLYTPNTWTPGSSYSHLDESTYPAGNPNSLMTFGIAQAEAIHDPGPVTLGMFGDSGWTVASPPVVPGPFSKTSPANGATNQPTTVSLAWGPSSGAASYEYCIDTSLNAACDTSWVSAASATSIGLSSLIAGTTYQWQVRAQNLAGTTFADAGTWWSLSTNALPASFSKSGPASGASNQPTSLTLQWLSSSGAASYEYCYDTLNNNICDTSWTSAGSALSVPVSGLSASTTYFWQTRARNVAGVTEANGGIWWTFSTQLVAPGVSGKIMDLNADGIADILLQHSGLSWVAGWLMNSAGQIDRFVPVHFNDIGDWNIVGAMDLNLDGVTDILLQHSTATWVAAWLMNQAGQINSFVPVHSSDLGSWRVAGTADLNRDGVTDILLQHSTMTWVAAWLMNGAGQIASFVYIHSGNIGEWRVVATADLNGDGISDIVLQHQTMTWVAGWLMNAAGQINGYVPVFSGDIGQWKVVGTIDLNRDGIDDLLLQHSTATWVAAWLMDGAGHPATFVEMLFGDIGQWRVNGK